MTGFPLMYVSAAAFRRFFQADNDSGEDSPYSTLTPVASVNESGLATVSCHLLYSDVQHATLNVLFCTALVTMEFSKDNNNNCGRNSFRGRGLKTVLHSKCFNKANKIKKQNKTPFPSIVLHNMY